MSRSKSKPSPFCSPVLGSNSPSAFSLPEAATGHANLPWTSESRKCPHWAEAELKCHIPDQNWFWSSSAQENFSKTKSLIFSYPKFYFDLCKYHLDTNVLHLLNSVAAHIATRLHNSRPLAVWVVSVLHKGNRKCLSHSLNIWGFTEKQTFLSHSWCPWEQFFSFSLIPLCDSVSLKRLWEKYNRWGKERRRNIAKKQRKEGCSSEANQHVTEALMKGESTKGESNQKPRIKGPMTWNNCNRYRKQTYL